MVPNTNYRKCFPDTDLPDELSETVRSACLMVGLYLVIRKVISYYKLDKKLEKML